MSKQFRTFDWPSPWVTWDFSPVTDLSQSSSSTANNCRSRSITERVIMMMEKYAANLEIKVDERTAELQIEKQKADQLLYRMLPRWGLFSPANIRVLCAICDYFLPFVPDFSTYHGRIHLDVRTRGWGRKGAWIFWYSDIRFPHNSSLQSNWKRLEGSWYGQYLTH